MHERTVPSCIRLQEPLLPEDGRGSCPKHVGESKLRIVQLVGNKFLYIRKFHRRCI